MLARANIFDLNSRNHVGPSKIFGLNLEVHVNNVGPGLQVYPKFPKACRPIFSHLSTQCWLMLARANIYPDFRLSMLAVEKVGSSPRFKLFFRVFSQTGFKTCLAEITKKAGLKQVF